MKKTFSIALSFVIVICTLACFKVDAYAKTDYSAVFNATYYAQNNPDLASAGITSENALLNHFINNGMKEGRQGSDEFNVYAYMNRYPDLKAAYGSDLKSYYLHYINSGKAEGRNGRADGSAITPSTTVVNTTNPINKTVKNDKQIYRFGKFNDGSNDYYGSWLTLKPGTYPIPDNKYGRTRTITQQEIDKSRVNPYGLTEGYSVLTGYAKIGDIRYFNFTQLTQAEQCAFGCNGVMENGTLKLVPIYTIDEMYAKGWGNYCYKMECYAINKNGVPLFRRYGSNYNVYSNGQNLVPFIDAVTPTTTMKDFLRLKKDYDLGLTSSDRCTTIALTMSYVYSAFMIENYQVISDVYDHQECWPYAGNGYFYWGWAGDVTTVAEYKLSRNSEPGTFYLYQQSVH